MGGPITGGSPRAAVGKALSEAGSQQQEPGAGHPGKAAVDIQKNSTAPMGPQISAPLLFWGAWLSSPAALAAPSLVLPLDPAHMSANAIARVCCYCLFSRLLLLQWRSHKFSTQVPGQPEAGSFPRAPTGCAAHIGDSNYRASCNCLFTWVPLC